MWSLIFNNDRQVIYCSSSCKQVTGYPSKLFIENPNYLETIIHADDKAGCRYFFTMGSHGERPRKHEYRIIESTGKLKWISCSIEPIRFKPTDPTCTLVSNVDITAYRKKISKLEKEKNALNQRNETLTRELADSYQSTNNSQMSGNRNNESLRKASLEIIEANNALKSLARNINRTQKDTEKKIHNEIVNSIFPLVAKLNHKHDPSSINMLSSSLQYKLNELCNTLGGGRPALSGYLSARELSVAAYVKEGLNSNEIASKLNLSAGTVRTHRKNIRKKLNIQNAKINLSSYLRLKWNQI